MNLSMSWLVKFTQYTHQKELGAGGNLYPFTHSKKWLFFALIVFSILLSSCGSYASHEWLDAPDWGRSRLIGLTESGYPINPSTDNNGNLYFAFAHIEENVPIVVVNAFDQHLDLRWEKEFPLERLNRANRPSIALSNKGLEVFWILNGSLFSANLSTDGEILREPHRISGSRAVSHYVVGVTEAGERIAWFSGDRADPGLFFIDPLGNITSADTKGYKPQIVMGRDDGMHVGWLRNERGSINYEFLYAFYPNSEFVTSQEEIVLNLVLSLTAGLNGPELGIDYQNVYFFWAEQSRTGMTAGLAESYYATMPLGGEEMSPPIPLPFLFGYNLNYSEYEDFFLAGDRALPELQDVGAIPVIINTSANPKQRPEVALSVKANIPYLRNKLNTQVGLSFFSAGEITSFQLLSFSPGISEFSTIQSDDEGYLHSTWLEQNQTDDYRVYYSSTRPEAVAVLDDLDQEDAIRLAGTTLFGLVSGLVLIPFPLLWGLGPVLIFFILGFSRKENEAITAPGTLITLILAWIAYTFVKLFTMPNIGVYVPFSAWIPIIPSAWNDILRIGVPILTTLFAIFMAWRGTYARSNRSPLFFIFHFIIWDGLLTVALYGLLVYGAI